METDKRVKAQFLQLRPKQKSGRKKEERNIVEKNIYLNKAFVYFF